jgi:hypothetical protein
VAQQALWIEADVVISQNPFELLGRMPATLRTAAVAYNYEGVPCLVKKERLAGGLPSASVTGGVLCTKNNPPHEEPLNCGQLLLTSLPFATAVWSARPAAFYNGLQSQQHFANVIKHNFTHAALPLEFYNYCWQAQHTTRIVDPCRLVTYHATCGLRATEKLQMMAKFLRVTDACARSTSTTYAKALGAAPLATEWTFA